MNNRKTIGLWAGWRLVHLNERDYELLRTSGGRWVHNTDIHAINDTEACKQTEWLIATADQAED